MPETKSPTVANQYLPCALCGATYHESQIAMRGRLNFCATCANGRSSECLARLNGRARGHRGVVASILLLSLALLGGGGAWWGARVYLLHQPGITFSASGPAMSASAAPASPLPSASGAGSGGVAADSGTTGTSAGGSELSATTTTTSGWIRHLLDQLPTPAGEAEKTPRMVTDVGSLHFALCHAPRHRRLHGPGFAASLSRREAPNWRNRTGLRPRSARIWTHLLSGRRFALRRRSSLASGKKTFPSA